MIRELSHRYKCPKFRGDLQQSAPCDYPAAQVCPRRRTRSSKGEGGPPDQKKKKKNELDSEVRSLSEKVRQLGAAEEDRAEKLTRRLNDVKQCETVREIPRSRYRHATTLQHLRARKLVRRTRSVHSRTRAPAKLVSTTMDFRAFVAKAPHLTIPRQRTLVYGGKLLFSTV